MTLYFKVDKKDKVYLLFWGLLKLKNDSSQLGNILFARHVDNVTRTIDFIKNVTPI